MLGMGANWKNVVWVTKTGNLFVHQTISWFIPLQISLKETIVPLKFKRTIQDN